MKKQLTFEESAFTTKKKTLRREVFLQEMNKALPWSKFLTRLKKDYKEGNQNGRPKYPAELMLRIYFLQQWFQLSDEAAEEALYDTTSMRTFAGISLGTDTVPDENTIKNFRYFLQEHNLTEEFFAIGKEKKVYGDKAYANQTKKKSFISRGIQWCISRKAPSGEELSEKDKTWNSKQSSVRAKGETPFLVIKHLWKYRKVRYRGLERNTHQLFALFALANIFLVRKKLIASQR